MKLKKVNAAQQPQTVTTTITVPIADGNRPLKNLKHVAEVPKDKNPLVGTHEGVVSEIVSDNQGFLGVRVAYFNQEVIFAGDSSSKRLNIKCLKKDIAEGVLPLQVGQKVSFVFKSGSSLKKGGRLYISITQKKSEHLDLGPVKTLNESNLTPLIVFNQADQISLMNQMEILGKSFAEMNLIVVGKFRRDGIDHLVFTYEE